MKPIEDRFWSKVDKNDSNGCWIWTASIMGSNGYGCFRINKTEGTISAHRYSFILKEGKIPDSMLVCHTCDNPICVNPNHLFLGTHKDNAIDRSAKGRTKTFKKLTDQEVEEIKSSNLSQSKLSKIYNVSRASIANIIYGKTWKNINATHQTYTIECNICKELITKLYIDVNYKYRRIDESLCVRCDKVLKQFNHDIKLFESAASYLLQKD